MEYISCQSDARLGRALIERNILDIPMPRLFPEYSLECPPVKVPFKNTSRYHYMNFFLFFRMYSFIHRNGQIRRFLRRFRNHLSAQAVPPVRSIADQVRGRRNISLAIAVGFDKEGKTYRCGGWGRPLSDLGSGYWIGEQMLKKWIKYCDGQEAYNEIYQTLEEFYHFEKAEELPYYIAAMSQRDITAAAHLVCDGLASRMPAWAGL